MNIPGWAGATRATRSNVTGAPCSLQSAVNRIVVIDMPADYIAAALEITEEAAEAILVRAHGIVSGSAAGATRIAIAARAARAVSQLGP